MSHGVDENRQSNEQTFVEYPYRWFIVILMSLSFIINALANNAVIPIAKKLSDTYQLSDTYVDAPVFISFLVYSLMNFPANHLIDTKGLRFSLVLGNLFYTLGLFFFSLIDKGYYMVVLGAILVAIGQPFIINCPAKIAALWFSQNNTGMATGIMLGINIIALGIGFVTPTLAVKEDSTGQQAKKEVYMLYFAYFISGLIVLILQLKFMKAKPPTPASKSSEQQKISVIDSFKMIKKDKNLCKFFIAYTLIYGTFLTNGSISNQIIKPYQYQDTQIALIGVFTLIAGVLGSVFYSYSVKTSKNYKKILKIMITITLIVLILYVIWLNSFGAIVGTILFAMLLGFNFAPIVPISYDLGCQLAFPIGQAQVIGILNGGSMMLTFVLTLVLSRIVGFGSKGQSITLFSIFIILIGIGSFVYLSIDINLKRSEFEGHNKNKEIQMQQKGNIKTNNQIQDVVSSEGYQTMNQEK